MKDLTPHQLIMRAASYGVGLRLTAAQAKQLARDNGIELVSSSDCGDQGLCECCFRPQHGGSCRV